MPANCRAAVLTPRPTIDSALHETQGPMNFTEKELIPAAAAFGVELTSVKFELLQRYVRAILAENAMTNVTAVRSEDEAATRLVLDALAFGLHLREYPLPADACLADYGSGGGFPGVVLGLVWPTWTVHLVESRGRKLEAVRRALTRLPADNIKLQHARMQDMVAGSLANRCDVITCRAVGSLRETLKCAVPALKIGGSLVVWKSDPIEAKEIEQAIAAAARCETLPPLQYTSFKPSQLFRFRRKS